MVLTAHELAQRLLAGPDLPVHLSYDARDHWHTHVAPPLEDVDVKAVRHDTYHNTDRLVRTEEDDNPDDPKKGDRNVVVLS